MRIRFRTFSTDNPICLQILRNSGFLSRTCLILFFVICFFWMSFWKTILSMARNSGLKFSLLRRPWRHKNVVLMLICLLKWFIYSPISTYISVDFFWKWLLVGRSRFPLFSLPFRILPPFPWMFPSIFHILLWFIELLTMDFVFLFVPSFPGLDSVGGITNLRKQYVIFLEKRNAFPHITVTETVPGILPTTVNFLGRTPSSRDKRRFSRSSSSYSLSLKSNCATTYKRHEYGSSSWPKCNTYLLTLIPWNL